MQKIIAIVTVQLSRLSSQTFKANVSDPMVWVSSIIFSGWRLDGNGCVAGGWWMVAGGRPACVDFPAGIEG
jgi:hypothetical protein